jgi:hypothetical protein
MFKDRVIVEGSWNVSKDINSMQKEMTTNIQKLTIKMFGVISKNKCEPKYI